MVSPTKNTTQEIQISKMNDLLFQIDLYMILNLLEYYSTLIYIFVSFAAFDHVHSSYGNCLWRKPLFAVQWIANAVIQVWAILILYTTDARTFQKNN